MSPLHDVLQQLSHSHLPWLVLTMAVYLATLALYKRSRCHPLLIPVFPSVVIIVGVLLATDTPYATYQQGVQWLSLLIGPATVALAIPLYAQRARIYALWKPIAVALLVGCVVALLSAMGIAWALGGSWETLISLAPKSATIPIALPMAERFGGLPSLAAVAVAVTGISGCMLAPLLLRIVRSQDPAVEGFAQGLTAHAIGTARSIQINPTAGAFAALAMGLNGVLTALLMPLCVALFQKLP
ncbi:LrgB family protein [Comamonas jiangduensis]|jgi:predicted murein hydrolase (TIGR00659 family)|uniref:LrgB family protein n=1 Tax=Comamonas jiangduensis TaxID=1194168 RepID=A0ABV4IE07_9BURK|nr:LrgB family protein [Comamonas jiangduensis]QXW19233.1 LrgB family protein [Comamonas aquatica]